MLNCNHPNRSFYNKQMQSNQKTIFCPKCQKQINSPNYLIHQAMCRGNRESFIIGGLNRIKSRESRDEYDKGNVIPQYPQISEEKEKKQEKREKKETEKEPQGKPKVEYPPLYQPEKRYQTNQNKTNINKQQKPQKPNSTTPPKTIPNVPPKKPPQSEQQERFRCTDCGYMMTMKELDSHPNTCQARQKKCQYCNLMFPHYLMDMHLEVCEKLPNRNEPRRPSNERQHIRQELDRRQQQDQIERNRGRNPRGTREGNIPANVVPVEQQTFVRREGNDRVTIRRVRDRNGRVYEERYRQPLQQQQQESEDEEQGYRLIVPISMGQGGGMAFINMEDLFSGSNPLEQIIRRLMTTQHVDQRQNPGLTKQQITKLPIIKYDPDSNPKSTSCTICVTDFEKGTQVMKLPCGHLFNPQCVAVWLKNSAVCPNCRGKVKPS